MLYPSIRQSARLSARGLSSSAARCQQQEVVGVVGPSPPIRRTGGFRSGVLGFLFGTALTSGATVYYLQHETKTASAMLLASVEELQQSSDRITTHLDRLTRLEKEVATLRASVAGREDVTKIKGENKKLYDGLHLEILDLRAHVWGLEQDLQKVVKSDSIRL